MKLIGITGGVGCGKSTSTEYVKSKGYVVLDADLIVRDLFTQPQVQQQIQTKFQTLDKKELRSIIFQSPEKRKWLENILHPRVMENIQQEISKHRKSGEKILFISIPLLFEKKLDTMFDDVIVISCDRTQQIQRLQERDKINTKLIDAMIDSQWPIAEKEKKTGHVIVNGGSIQEFHQKIDGVLEKIQR